MKKIVISIGGSLIDPKELDLHFLKNLKTVLRKHRRNKKIILVTGGGHLAREYMQPVIGEKEKNTIGIACTKLHALLLSHILGLKKNIPVSIKELQRRLKNENILVCGGLHLNAPMTSDGTAAEIAKHIHAEYFMNMTNVKGLYTKDPKKWRNAKRIKKMSLKEFYSLAKKHHEKPGQHFVLDIHAAKVCKESEIPILIFTGTKNLQNILCNKSWEGTFIS